MIEIRLATVDRLGEALALPADAIGIGQEGCLTKLPTTDELRQAAAEVRAAGRAVVVVAPIAWPRTADELYKRLNQVVANLNGSIDRINSGQGALGQLLVNPQLYESLNGATREAQSLIKDIRANPKKFLRIKLALF